MDKNYNSFQVDPSVYRNKIEMVTMGIKNAILSGAIKSEERLSSEELCRIFNVSRAPVREALRRLESDGLVTIIPQKYVQVQQIDTRSFEELSQLRLCLELFAFRLLTSRISHEILEALRNIAQEEIDVSDPKQAFEIAIRFHREMVQLAGNRELLYYYIKMMEKYQRFMHLHYKPKQLLKPYHMQILDILERGDYESAEKLLILDLEECEQHVRIPLEKLVTETAI